MKNNTHKFWIQHKESVKQHWPIAAIHVILAVWLVDFFMGIK